MPLFPGAYRVNERTQTKLVVSEGDAPAERWIVDETLPALFEYHWGGVGQVVIPKGFVVSVRPTPQKDWETGRRVTPLTIANPGAGLKPIGVSMFNVFKRENDRFLGNQPTVITRNYIELPYIPHPDDAAMVKWGLAFGDLQAGDYVKATNNPNNLGKVEKWNPSTDDPSLVVGQVLAMEYDMPPTGWLKWVAPEIDPPGSERALDTNTSGVTPDYDYKTDQGGYPFDPLYKWPAGNPDYRAENLPWMKTYQGIPGLTDGVEMATRYARATATAGDNVIALPDGPAGPVYTVEEVLVDGVAAAMAEGNDPSKAADGEYTYDLAGKSLTIKGLTGGEAVVVKYHTKRVVGVLPGWNYAGATGAVRILLKF